MPENVYKSKKRDAGTGFFSRMTRIVIRILQLSVFVLLLFWVSWGLVKGYHWLVNTPRLAVRDILITGNHHFDEDRIMEKAGIKRHQNILQLRIEEVKDRLVRDPWIDSVLIRRELPGRLHLQVRERAPVFIIQKKETLFYADAKGQEIGPVQADHFISLPLLVFDGASPRQRRKLELLHSCFLKRQLPFSLAESSWLRFLAAGEVVEFYLQGRRLKVVLDTRGLVQNIESLRRIWRDLDTRGELERTVRILVAKDTGWVKKENQV
ncbi:MAG: FtsQ-type POTRA domain-containing protein [Desulfohalobiaceae bacterium]|nr:FtsQ-type POTRA domain-containing protein [Desulfohalobiaceae bacterium]